MRQLVLDTDAGLRVTWIAARRHSNGATLEPAIVQLMKEGMTIMVKGSEILDLHQYLTTLIHMASGDNAS